MLHNYPAAQTENVYHRSCTTLLQTHMYYDENMIKSKSHHSIASGSLMEYPQKKNGYKYNSEYYHLELLLLSDYCSTKEKQRRGHNCTKMVP